MFDLCCPKIITYPLPFVRAQMFQSQLTYYKAILVRGCQGHDYLDYAGAKIEGHSTLIKQKLLTKSIMKFCQKLIGYVISELRRQNFKG